MEPHTGHGVSSTSRLASSAIIPSIRSSRRVVNASLISTAVSRACRCSWESRASSASRASRSSAAASACSAFLAACSAAGSARPAWRAAAMRARTAACCLRSLLDERHELRSPAAGRLDGALGGLLLVDGRGHRTLELNGVDQPAQRLPSGGRGGPEFGGEAAAYSAGSAATAAARLRCACSTTSRRRALLTQRGLHRHCAPGEFDLGLEAPDLSGALLDRALALERGGLALLTAGQITRRFLGFLGLRACSASRRLRQRLRPRRAPRVTPGAARQPTPGRARRPDRARPLRTPAPPGR